MHDEDAEEGAELALTNTQRSLCQPYLANKFADCSFETVFRTEGGDATSIMLVVSKHFSDSAESI